MTEAIYYILLSLRQPNHGYGIIQEVKEVLVSVTEDFGSESPEIHGYYGIVGKMNLFAVFFKPCAAFFLEQLHTFYDLGQHAVFSSAFASGNAAVVGNGIAQLITHHTEIVLFAIAGIGQELIDALIG